jgi:hypothetical protein
MFHWTPSEPEVTLQNQEEPNLKKQPYAPLGASHMRQLLKLFADLDSIGTNPSVGAEVTSFSFSGSFRDAVVDS